MGNNASCQSTRCPLNYIVGVSSTAVRFDGLDDRLDINYNTSLNPTDEITLSAWINPIYDINNNSFQTIISKRLDYELTYRNDGRLRVGIVNESGKRKLIDSAPNTIPINHWSYLVMTYDGSTIKGYVNGVLKISVAQTGKIRQGQHPVQIGSVLNK